MARGAPGSGAEVAAQTLFTASAAANAIPVAGQFVSAGLALAGLFTKIFGGRRRKKKAEEARKRQANIDRIVNASKDQRPAAAGPATVGGAQSGRQVGISQPVSAPQTSSFSSFGGGQAPSVQPTQQALNNTLGLK